MRICGIDCPSAILDAQERESLVIFAGAGVSIPAPSNFPNFVGLADQVSQGTLPREVEEPTDHFLGRLFGQGVQVHERVKNLLSDPKSAPNRLHYDLLRLFKTPESVRVVTTNFDIHFTTAANAIFGPDHGIEIHSAPALPIGDTFHGLVHLHGSITKPAQRLVLTDADFGKAYLTEGWARRFLQRLFSQFTVLFVGYSHNDVVMNYLARGLPLGGTSKRFTLAPQGEDARWSYLGITPISYKLSGPEDKHSSVLTFVQGWAELARRGTLDHEQKIKTLVESPLTLDPNESDYIERMLKVASTAQFFTRYAKRVDWLKWVESKNFLDRLFLPNAEPSDVDQLLSWWFAQTFVCEHPGAALALVQRRGQQLNPLLWRAITHRIFSSKPVASTLGKWLPVLFKSIPQNADPDLFGYILHNLQLPGYQDTALLLFDVLTRPRLLLKKDIWGSLRNPDVEDVDFEIDAPGSEYWLNQSWGSIFRPNLPEFATKLTWIITLHLQQSYLLLRSAGKADGGWDPLSFGRSKIDAGRGGLTSNIDVLIDAACEILEWNIANNRFHADALIELWISSDIPVLRRIALHGVDKSGSWGPDKKIMWLLQNKLIFAPGLRQDVLNILKGSYANATDESEAAALSAIRNSDLGDSETKAFETYRILNWLSSLSPENGLAKKELARLVSEYPNLAFKEKQFVDAENEKTSQERLLELTRKDALLSRKPEEQQELLLGKTDDSSDMRQALFRGVRSAAGESPLWGLNLSRFLAGAGNTNSHLWPAVLEGWTGAALADVDWYEILAFLQEQSETLFELISYQVATFLEQGIKKAKNAIPDSDVEQAIRVAELVWRAIDSRDETKPEQNDDWLFIAINHPSGILAEFLLQAISRQRKMAGADWPGLAVGTKAFLTLMADGKSYSSELGRVLLSSQLQFLFASDPEWAVTNLLPSLDWSVDKRRALQCWDGYLTWGRLDSSLLPKLLPLYEKLFPVLNTSFKKKKERFCGQLATIACYSSINPLTHGWLKRFLLLVGAEEREMFAAEIRSILREMKATAKEAIWQEWMSAYWQDRIEGIPKPMSSEEAGEMAEWSAHLEPVFSQAVAKICSSVRPQLQHSFIYRELKESDLLNTQAGSVAELVAFLLQSESGPMYDLEVIGEMFRILLSQGAARKDLLTICEELARLGYPGAAGLRSLLPGS
jgi:hypothetical protein